MEDFQNNNLQNGNLINDNLDRIVKKLNDKKLYIKQEDNTNLNKEVRDIINKYIRLDQAYRLKHQELQTLHLAYKKLYNKHRRDNNTNELDNCLKKLGEIHSHIDKNSENMYHQRLMIIKKIREEPKIPEEDKKFLARRMMVIFRVPPIQDYKPIQIPLASKNEYKQENTVETKEIDEAYIRKHNELMQMYKAYKNLYNKVLDYKSKLQEFQSLKIKSSLSRGQMNKMLEDQKFIMSSLDRMQTDLVKRDILTPEERVPTTPVVGNMNNIHEFTDGMKRQINYVIDNNTDITPTTKDEIHNILGTLDDDERDARIRRILLYRK
jgi:hypothetical protein